jgi:type I restriction enzyme, S subunit
VNLSRDAARIAPAARVHGQWLCFALKSDASQKQFDYNEIGTTVTGVNIRDLKRVAIPVPPQDEQQAIAAHLGGVEQRHLRLRSAIELHLARLKEMRSALITAAVTGQIDVRGRKAAA